MREKTDDEEPSLSSAAASPIRPGFADDDASDDLFSIAAARAAAPAAVAAPSSARSNARGANLFVERPALGTRPSSMPIPASLFGPNARTMLSTAFAHQWWNRPTGRKSSDFHASAVSPCRALL